MKVSLSPSQISHFADEYLRFTQFSAGDAVRESESERERERETERESNLRNAPNPLRLAVFLEPCTLQGLTELTTHTVIHPWTLDYGMMGHRHRRVR